MIHRPYGRNGSQSSSVLSNLLSDFLGACTADGLPHRASGSNGPKQPNQPNRRNGGSGSSGSGADSGASAGEGSGGVDVALEDDVRDKLQQPPKFAVVLMNDDYTPMEFVVEVLKRFFKRTEEEALQIMLRVHQEGRGVAGVYSHDIAETKVFQVLQLAKSRGYPLHCVIEPLK